MSELRRDGITVYKVNSKTNERVEVGYIALNGRIMFISPKRSISEIDADNLTTYRRNFEIPETNSKAQSCTSIKPDDREVLVKDGNHTWSIGYFANSKLVFWSQYE